MKYLLLLSPLALAGCAVTEWIVSNEQAIDGASDVAGGAGPYGAIVALGASLAVAGAKWYEGKQTMKDLVNTVQKAKSELPDESKKILTDGLHKHMPSKIKKVVAKVKKGLS